MRLQPQTLVSDNPIPRELELPELWDWYQQFKDAEEQPSQNRGIQLESPSHDRILEVASGSKPRTGTNASPVGEQPLLGERPPDLMAKEETKPGEVSEQTITNITAEPGFSEALLGIAKEQLGTEFQAYDLQLIRSGLILTGASFIAPYVLKLLPLSLTTPWWLWLTSSIAVLTMLLTLVFAVMGMWPSVVDYLPSMRKFIDDFQPGHKKEEVLLRLAHGTGVATEGTRKVVKRLATAQKRAAVCLLISFAMIVLSSFYKSQESSNARQTDRPIQQQTHSESGGQTPSQGKASGK